MAAGTRAQKPQRASPRAERPSIDSARAGHRVPRFGEPGRSLSMSSEAEGAGRYRLVPLIVSSALFTGISGNYLRPSIVAAGLDPDKLPAAAPPRTHPPVSDAHSPTPAMATN